MSISRRNIAEEGITLGLALAGGTGDAELTGVAEGLAVVVPKTVCELLIVTEDLPLLDSR